MLATLQKEDQMGKATWLKKPRPDDEIFSNTYVFSVRRPKPPSGTSSDSEKPEPATPTAEETPEPGPSSKE
jgi:hypothetical protein